MPTTTRIQAYEGRYALVDGIPYHLPVYARNSPALMAGFPIDATRAAALLPGNELHPVTLWDGRGLLLVTVINYLITSIGRYIEFSIAIACTHGPRPAPPLLPGMLIKRFGTGQFILDLPVSTEVSVKGGKGIWGMPKHQANLAYHITDTEVISHYEKDGQFAVRIEIDKPKKIVVPVNVGATNYCQFRNMLMASNIYFRGRAGIGLLHRANARLYVGDHPNVAALKTLDIDPQALFTLFIPAANGVLDDYFQCWFLTYDTPPATMPEGLESVVDLGRSETWLAPPREEDYAHYQI
ncbi:Acetoacetate decarboxylase (ADC) [Catalinimonas alkaloidigena]|uniref:Acetoacetate decarboxylase (ADC) n=1 Tax=Catalinimonas alkaloidigena TaxID=1075417 RepID=A0A1G9GDI1_9BACT|nr:acetoacetate decarboxylase family protein [Catalinimonas alkaloidigena]SDK98662.1 Acetoacetate decarboxylase (ADC) [Catalinimonas alkaloidigena]